MLAYIDPGIISLAIQALFAAIFGVATVFLLGPRRWLAWIWRRTFSRLRGKSDVPAGDSDSTGSQHDPASADLQADP